MCVRGAWMDLSIYWWNRDIMASPHPPPPIHSQIQAGARPRKRRRRCRNFRTTSELVQCTSMGYWFNVAAKSLPSRLDLRTCLPRAGEISEKRHLDDFISCNSRLLRNKNTHRKLSWYILPEVYLLISHSFQNQTVDGSCFCFFILILKQI